MTKNIYKPIPVSVSQIVRQTDDTSLLRLVRSDGREFPKIPGKASGTRPGLSFIPGQFVMAGVWGFGEAPFGIASSPYERSYMKIVVRGVGHVSNALIALKKGERATIRGPYGNGYPLDFLTGMEILLITGGSGIPPIASLIEYIIANRAEFGRTNLLYGAATPDGLLMKKQRKRWKRSINVELSVDQSTPGWRDGCEGPISVCLRNIKLDRTNTAVAMCGPGPMVDAIEHLLNTTGIPDRRIFISMERKMQCGVGKCQHCVTGTQYVCTDGPVFNLDTVDKNWD
ncbi:MAG: FAD/NAD(P)-binding protein [Thermodesulfobacteriota bacterium]